MGLGRVRVPRAHGSRPDPRPSSPTPTPQMRGAHGKSAGPSPGPEGVVGAFWLPLSLLNGEEAFQMSFLCHFISVVIQSSRNSLIVSTRLKPTLDTV